ncbi:MAG: ferritin-like domain-containing protein [Solirubrobacteraceae bacterium]
MTPASIDEQLSKYLTDAHSIEEQALAQLRVAPGLAGEPELADALRDHLAETEGHEQLVRARLEARGASPSRVKDLVMKAGGLGFVLFAKSQPDTPGKLAAHAYSYEHLELASYELLMRVAQRAGDHDTAVAAGSIRDEEARMAQRLEGLFDRTVEASLRDVGPDDLTVQLAKYMADAHAVETQSAQLLERAPSLTDDPELQRVYAEHLEETRGHLRTLEERLAAHEAEPSRLKDAALRLGGLNWGAFFQAQPDTPGKLAAFAYAVEHLEAGGYEQLKRVAQRAGDLETAHAAERILGEEHAAAQKIAGTWDRVVDASLS